MLVVRERDIFVLLAFDESCIGPETIGLLGPSCELFRWMVEKRAYSGASEDGCAMGAGVDITGLELEPNEAFLSRKNRFIWFSTAGGSPQRLLER